MYYAETVMPKDGILTTYSERFRIMLDEAQVWAENSGLTEKDVDEAIKSVRRRSSL